MGRALIISQTYKRNKKPAAVNNAASLPDELNEFYARFEAHNNADTERAPRPTQRQSEHSPSLYIYIYH